MKCQRCGKTEATIHYIEIEEEQKSHLWICEDCARDEGIAADMEELADLLRNDKQAAAVIDIELAHSAHVSTTALHDPAWCGPITFAP